MSHAPDRFPEADVGPPAASGAGFAAFAGLPARWVGAPPQQIAESLADALFDSLHPAFALVTVPRREEGAPIIAGRVQDSANASAHLDQLAATLHHCTSENGRNEPITLHNLPSFGDVRIAARTIPTEGGRGMIAAGFVDENAPNAQQQLLVELGAAHASAALLHAERIAALERAVAERERTIAELRHQVTVGNAINASVGEGVITVDAAKRVTFVNPAAETLLGFSADELRGRSFHRALHYRRPDGRPYPEEECPFLGVLKTGEAVHRNDESFVRKDGSVFPVSVTAAPIVGPEGVTGATFVFRDISERKSADFALRTAENRKAAILNTSIDAIILSDHRGRIVDFNPAAEKIFGYHRADVLGRSMAELIIPERYRPEHNDGMRRFIETGTAGVMGERLELPALRADGSEFMAELAIAHIPDTNPPVFTAFLRDITMRLERERTLRVLSDLNEATQPLTDPDEIMWTVANLLGRHLDANRCAYSEVLPNEDEFVITGDYTHETFSIIGRFRMSDFGAETMRVMRENKVLVIEDVERDDRLAGKREAFRAIDTAAAICVPLHKAGRLVASLAVHQKKPRHWTPTEIELVRVVANRCWDSLERAQALEALRESEERHRLIIETVKDFAILSVDLAGRITHWNPGAQEVFGWTEEEMLGQTLHRIYTPEDRAEAVPERELREAAVEGCAPDDRWHLRKDGRRIFLTGAARPIYDRKGDVIGVNKVARDITRRKQTEDELREAREHLEKTVQERTARLRETVGELEAYSYSIAHDMRAPLRAMQGFSQILLEEQSERLDPSGREHLQRIVNAADRLDNLIQDILTYSKIARGDLKLEPVDLDQLVVEMIDHYPNFQSPDAEVDVAHPLTPVLGHAASLNQCVSNLLANAVKFVAPGTRPRVRVWTEQRGDRVRLWVADNGVGISAENRQRIFDIFVRIHPDKAYPGTGIGLSIVRKAVERMGGAFGVESELGQGSRFWIELQRG